MKFATLVSFFVVSLWSLPQAKSKSYTRTVTVHFGETDSRLMEDTTVSDEHGTYDGAPFRVYVFSKYSSDCNTTVKTVLIRVRANMPNDTFFLPFGYAYNWIKDIDSGSFRLCCFSRAPIYKKFETPISWNVLKDKRRTIKIYLGNSDTTYRYEINSDQRLTRKEYKAIDKKLHTYFDTEPDYADLFGCKVQSERYYNAPECGFYTKKKCTVERVKP